VFYNHNGTEAPESFEDRSNKYTPKDSEWLKKAKELKALREKVRNESYAKEEVKAIDEDEIVYIGQAFDLFLICQKGDSLYLVDQHA
ncbi:hypothetical protein, partial [Salmonella enterica]|uniref:hypothetical protein n=1 Tax=Salmonella enterica TaxID=28901 RepID=UPI003CEE53F5